MRVRPIAKSELARFAHMPGSDNPDWVEATLKQFWDDGRSKSAWCYVAEQDDGSLAGRVAFWAEDNEPDHRYMLGLHLPWADDYVAVGRKLLGNTLALQKAAGAAAAEYYFYEQYNTHPEERQLLMDSLEFELRHAKWRYLWEDTGKPVEASGRLSFRSCEEAGDDAFTSALARIMEDTLDADDTALAEQKGFEGAARGEFDGFLLLDDRRCLWQLAYASDDSLVGLVVPQRLDDAEGTINHIGVVPEHRGNRYVDDLLAKGTAVLQEEGFKVVVAEVDQENGPMLAALERAGFRQTGAIWSYMKNLLRAT